MDFSDSRFSFLVVVRSGPAPARSVQGTECVLGEWLVCDPRRIWVQHETKCLVCTQQEKHLRLVRLLWILSFLEKMCFRSGFYGWLLGKGSKAGSGAVPGSRVLAVGLRLRFHRPVMVGCLWEGTQGAQVLGACGGWRWRFLLGLGCPSWPALSCEGVENTHGTAVTAFQLTSFVSCCDFPPLRFQDAVFACRY